MTIVLPEWSTCEKRVDDETANPIEKFIFDHELAGQDAKHWRYDLQQALICAVRLAEEQNEIPG